MSKFLLKILPTILLFLFVFVFLSLLRPRTASAAYEDPCRYCLGGVCQHDTLYCSHDTDECAGDYGCGSLYCNNNCAPTSTPGCIPCKYCEAPNWCVNSYEPGCSSSCNECTNNASCRNPTATPTPTVVSKPACLTCVNNSQGIPTCTRTGGWPPSCDSTKDGCSTAGYYCTQGTQACAACYKGYCTWTGANPCNSVAPCYKDYGTPNAACRAFNNQIDCSCTGDKNCYDPKSGAGTDCTESLGWCGESGCSSSTRPAISYCGGVICQSARCTSDPQCGGGYCSGANCVWVEDSNHGCGGYCGGCARQLGVYWCLNTTTNIWSHCGQVCKTDRGCDLSGLTCPAGPTGTGTSEPTPTVAGKSCTVSLLPATATGSVGSAIDFTASVNVTEGTVSQGRPGEAQRQKQEAEEK
jgi:hypothetical protein